MILEAALISWAPTSTRPHHGLLQFDWRSLAFLFSTDRLIAILDFFPLYSCDHSVNSVLSLFSGIWP